MGRAGLHGPNSVILYLPRSEKGLGIIKLTHYFKNGAIVREHLLKHSDDPVIRRLAERRLEQGRENAHLKWTAPEQLHTAERGLFNDHLMNAGQQGRAGIGFGSQHRGELPEAGTSEHRQAVTQWLKTQNVQELLVSLTALSRQQDWRQWDAIMAQDLSWGRLLYRMAESDVKFLLQGTLQILPTPQYLRTMGYIPGMSCPLCGTKCCSFKHIASYCPFALEQQRYTWRHNEVLKLLHYVIGLCVRALQKRGKPKKPPAKKASFVLQGQDLPKKEKDGQVSLLEQACDWHITVDLPAVTYKFPFHIAVTEKRPDLVIWSETLRVIVLLELTVPHESNVQAAHARKMASYTKLQQECRDAGYRVELLPVEVGVLGYVADSTKHALKKLGVWSKELHGNISEMAMRCTYAIYVQHKTKSWTDWRMFQPSKYSQKGKEPDD